MAKGTIKKPIGTRPGWEEDALSNNKWTVVMIGSANVSRQ
jgi:hypothetical protein